MKENNKDIESRLYSCSRIISSHHLMAMREEDESFIQDTIISCIRMIERYERNPVIRFISKFIK